MKKLIAVAVMALVAFSASAQTKIGFIDTDELISVMPEAAKVDGELKEFQASLVQQGQDMGKDADEKAQRSQDAVHPHPRGNEGTFKAELPLPEEIDPQRRRLPGSARSSGRSGQGVRGHGPPPVRGERFGFRFGLPLSSA